MAELVWKGKRIQVKIDEAAKLLLNGKDGEEFSESKCIKEDEREKKNMPYHHVCFIVRCPFFARAVLLFGRAFHGFASGVYNAVRREIKNHAVNPEANAAKRRVSCYSS